MSDRYLDEIRAEAARHMAAAMLDGAADEMDKHGADPQSSLIFATAVAGLTQAMDRDYPGIKSMVLDLLKAIGS